jgi:hypothetical protein
VSGHNHYASCTCGWCLKRRGGQSGVLYAGGGTRAAFRTFESFTIPNAACPVCGSSVFFYQSPTGGRVFFDELGPPWPKHPCTDQGPVSPGRITVANTRRTLPAWIGEGWTPVILQNSRMSGQWHVVPVEVLARRVHIEVLCAEPMRVPPQCVASMRPFDGYGRGELSIVDLNGPSSSWRVMIFDRKRFSTASPFSAAKAARKPAHR